jgi:hypothetical protein
MLPVLLKQRPSEGEKPSRAGSDRTGSDRAGSDRAGSDGMPVPEENDEKRSPGHALDDEEFFADFPRPAERRAKEFLPQWLRRLGRG